MPSLSLTVDAFLTGTPRPLPDGTISAMAKAPVEGPVRVTWLGLEGDAVANPVDHGGHDKAIHLYPFDHYGWWRGQIGDHPLLSQAGAFGENIALQGAVDGDFCLGDRFEIGSAVVEISHGRQPCSKINSRFERRDMVSRVIESGRAGLYLRVIREGEAEAGMAMTLIQRPLPHWPMDRVFDLLIAGGHRSEPDAVRALASERLLAEAWRSRAERLVR